MNGLLLISTPVLTLLYKAVVIPLFSVTVNCVPAIPVNSKDISSRITLVSFASNGSNFLENNLPEKEELVSNPVGPALPYGASLKNIVSSTIL